MSTAPTVPPLADQACHLRPAMPADYDQLYLAETQGVERLVTYRHRGVPPSAEMYPQTLWGDVFVQFVVSPNSSGAVAGLVTCYGWNQRNQTAKLAVVSAPASVDDADALTMRGLLLFGDYLFATQPIRKLYAEVLAWNRHRFESMLRHGASLEGVLVGHELHGETAVDLYIYGITRETWTTFRSGTATVWTGVAPSEAVCAEAGTATLEGLYLSSLDSLARVTVSEILECEYELSLPDDAIDAMTDEQFRELLIDADRRWHDQGHLDDAATSAGRSSV